MSGKKLERATLEEFTRRIGALRPESARRWGTMTPVAMLGHLRRSLELGLGEIVMPDQSNVLTRTVLKWIAFDLPLAWPKGKVKAPAELMPEGVGDFQSGREALLAKVRQFTEAAAREPGRIVVSPVFGPMPLSYWTRVHGRHLDHHLRQFGV